MECQHESGGFGGNIRHDPQIVHTLNAVQVLTSFDKLNAFDIDKITNYIDGFTPHTCMTSLYSSHIHFLYSHTSCLLYPSSSMLTTHIFIFSNHLANPFLTLHPHHPCHPWTRSPTHFFFIFSHYPWLCLIPIPCAWPPSFHHLSYSSLSRMHLWPSFNVHLTPYLLKKFGYNGERKHSHTLTLIQ